MTTNCDPDDEVPPNRVNTTARLADLREVMIQNDLDAYIIPLDEEGRRTWISGFSGSNGDAIVTKDRVTLFAGSDSNLFVYFYPNIGSMLDRRTLLPASIFTARLQLGADENGATRNTNIHLVFSQQFDIW